MKTIMGYVHRLESIVKLYKNNYFHRLICIVSASVFLWLLINGGIVEAYLFPLYVWIIESITVDTFSDRDYIPSDDAIRDFFGSNDSPGYIAFCILYFVMYWVMFIFLIIQHYKLNN